MPEFRVGVRRKKRISVRKTLIEVKIVDYIKYLSLFLLVSCGGNNEGIGHRLDTVRQIVSDTSDVGYKTVSGYDDRDISGTIAIVGPLAETALIAEDMMNADRFDNVDGKLLPDGLPDFSGEMISPLFDLADEPYSGYMEKMNEDFIRELNVKLAVASVSGTCSSSPFDHSLSGVKSPAKVIVFSSTYSSAFGYRDVQEIFAAHKKDIALIAPVQSVAGHLLEKYPDLSVVGVWADIEVVASGAYGTVFSEKSRELDIKDFECICLSPSFTGDPVSDVMSYFDMYIAAGHQEKIPAVVVDDLRYASYTEELNRAAVELAASGEPSAEPYRRLMAEGFEFVSPLTTMSADCYKYLRMTNSFTHKIKYPEAEGFVTVPMSGQNLNAIGEDGFFNEGFKFDRACGSNIETVCVIPASHRYLSEEQLSFMKKSAPVISKNIFYVYQ